MKNWKTTLQQQEATNRLINQLKKDLEQKSIEIYSPGGHRQVTVVRDFPALPEGYAAKLLSNGYVEVFTRTGASWGTLPYAQFVDLLTRWGYDLTDEAAGTIAPTVNEPNPSDDAGGAEAPAGVRPEGVPSEKTDE